MRNFKRKVRNLAERITGYQIEQLTSESLVLFSKKRSKDAWFSNRAQIRSIIEKFNINLIIDVGANEGQFGHFLRQFYFDEILSFEPVSSAFDMLNLASSNDPKWHIQNIALGSQNTMQMINVSQQTQFSSFLKTNEYCSQRFQKDSLPTKQEVTTVRRLDKLLDEAIPSIDNKQIFLKMDTQGYDLEVFKGVGDKIKNIIALQSEISMIPIYDGMPTWMESISTFEKAGFSLVGLFPVNPDEGKIIEYDCLMVKTTTQ
jgi:FkbM family methyltransferase